MSEPDLRGPLLWANWRAFNADSPYLGAVEYEVLTDANVVENRLEVGPFLLINTIGSFVQKRLEARIVVRVNQHLSKVMPVVTDFNKTSIEYYVGEARQVDQLASLLTLALGARFRGGNETRWFMLDDDPLGRPINLSQVRLTLTFPDDRSMIPGLTGKKVKLSEAEPVLAAVPGLEPGFAAELLRAARLYRQALWIADDEPELSWLLLVSAAEVGAVHWTGFKQTKAEQLEEALPEVVAILRDNGAADLIAPLAKKLAHLAGSTSRFVTFMTHFGSAPTEPIGEKWEPIDWQQLPSIMKMIYHHRSGSLHAGIPFPQPLLSRPFLDDLDRPTQRPLGLSHQYGEGIWSAKETPMDLHVFADLVRRSLLAWLRETAAS